MTRQVMNHTGNGKPPLPVLAALVTAGACLWSASALAQDNDGGKDPGPPRTVNVLAVKQELVLDRLLRLEDRLFRLSQAPQETEAAQADRLVRAIRAGKELMIQERIERAVELLGGDRITEARELQESIAADLRAMLDILTDDGVDPQEQREYIELLEDTLRELDELIEAQQRANEETVKLAEAPGGDTPAREEPGALEAGRTPGELAADQRDLAERADATADRMESREAGDDDVPGAEPIAGTDNVERAAESMERAADQLARKQPAEAVPEQDRAVEELRQARRQVEEELARQQQKQKAQALGELERRFQEMLAAQEALTARTGLLAELDESAWTRAEVLEAAALGGGERGLGEDAAAALELLQEDGTTVVFVRVVELLGDDLATVSELLEGRQVAGRTPRLQADIEATLADLIEAVQQSGQGEGNFSMPDGNEGTEGQSPPQSLLPDLAEVKLLRALQVRVTERTRGLAERYVSQGLDEDAVWQSAAVLAERQHEVAELAARMAERIGQP